MASLDKTLYCIAVIRETEVLPFNGGWSSILISEVNAKISTELRKYAIVILEEKPENRPELWKGEKDFVMQNLVQRDTENPSKSIAVLQKRHQILLRLYISVLTQSLFLQNLPTHSSLQATSLSLTYLLPQR